MECKNCEYKKICKDLLSEGFDDLSCDDVANIAKAGAEE